LRKIKQEVEQYMTGLTPEGHTLTARFLFPDEFIGFQGHFPTKKILPGVCQLQCALSTLEKGSGKAAVLKEVMSAKYFSPVFPDDEVTCTVSGLGDAVGELIVKALLKKNELKISELKLRVSFSGRGNNT